jgi:hypothetical protein
VFSGVVARDDIKDIVVVIFDEGFPLIRTPLITIGINVSIEPSDNVYTFTVWQ